MVRKALIVCVPAMALAVALAAGPLWDVGALEGAPFQLPLIVILLGFVTAELVSVEVESRNEAHSMNFVEFVYVAALVFSTPAIIVVARPVASLVTMGIVRRQSPYKLMINVSVTAAEAAVACFVFTTLIPGYSPVEPMGWLVILASTLAGYVVSSTLVTTAISLFNGFLDWRTVSPVLIFGLVVAVANTALGIVLVGSLWTKSHLGWLVLGVVAVLFLLYRAHTKLSERHKSLETLHDFTRSLSGAHALHDLEAAVVEGARSILRAENAALLLPPPWAGAPATRVVAIDDAPEWATVSVADLHADLEMLVPQREAALFAPGRPLPGWLSRLGVRDALMVPLANDGALIVANRLTEVSSFVEEDLQLFETLANHANVALANGRLVATLQHDAQEKAYQALHDPVTDLPNRTSLEESLREALAEAHRTEQKVGLVFVDLDTFKEVNDTLGIATGDAVLREVRRRLEPLLPDRSMLTRFTGDQFAIMVRGIHGSEEAEGLAELVDAEFDLPFVLGEASVVLAASIGVAVFPDHATTPDALVQRADAATYLARREGSGIEVYAPENDPQSQRRMSLAADLRVALEQDEVDVYVQPKMSLAEGLVVGAEALVRWTHPRLGPLDPDEFIGAAEQSGVIRPLTHYVVRNALQQCRTWRDAGLDLGISVNLSAKNLFEPRLADDIAGAIEDAGVPSSSLTLEITESTVMESRRSLEVLSDLESLGLNLSIDDFGTGYSSLTYLRKLPVSELKIDKSFVMTMTSNDQDAVIVRTLVELARSLGLKTVAEGVESPEAVRMLDGYGCVEAQGYFYSRPIPAEQFTAWLARQQVRRLDVGVVSFERERERRASGDSQP